MSSEEVDTSKLLVLEPLYGGCHQKLLDIVLKYIPKSMYTLITMPPKRWNWRARVSPVFMAENIPQNHEYEVLFCSSVLPLAKLIGLRPDLAPLFKVVYFHENHLAMPLNYSRDLKYELAYNEIMSCLAADQVLFNSKYNQRSLLKRATQHMKKKSDLEFDVNVKNTIYAKSDVVYFPLDLNTIDVYVEFIHKFPRMELYIVWPHRWEFDRTPKMFYRVVKRLEKAGYRFRVVMFPQSFMGKPTSPDVLIEQCSTSRLLHLENAENNLNSYYTILKRADVIVSTAKTDFFAAQILEGMYCDLIPVLPRIPVYKEMFKGAIKEMYNSEGELYHILAELCLKKQTGIPVRSYKHLCHRYESTKWFENLQKVLQCQLY